MHMRRIDRKHSGGLTLVEILVTLLVISIGLLGVAGLHSLSLRNNFDALMRSHASALAADIADRMRANRASALSGDYDVEFDQEVDVDDDSPLHIIDLNEWQTSLAATLPGGRGQVAMDPDTRIVTISITWGERGWAANEPDEEEEEESLTMTFVTETEI
jgi:type IV pilus assembly protein PilV